jgi:hypothetical protein
LKSNIYHVKRSIGNFVQWHQSRLREAKEKEVVIQQFAVSRISADSIFAVLAAAA